MAISAQRKGEIATLMVKHLVAHDLRLANISNLKRELGNVAKEIDVSLDELMEFSEILVEEIFADQMAKLRK